MIKFVITYREQHRVEFPELVRKAFASVKKFGYETVLIGSPVNSLDIDDFIPLGKGEPLLANWILYARQFYIGHPLFDCNTVFIDPDVLLVDNIDEVFTHDFDIAFTERELKGDEINTGVVFIKPDNKDGLVDFFTKLRNKCKLYPYNKQIWFGDQKCVNDILKEPVDINILLLPCDIYNASPCIEKTPEKQERNKAISKNAKIMHFKGWRKNMMGELWSS